MEVIKTAQTVTRTEYEYTYVAYDGTKFDVKWRCEEYEQNLKRAALKNNPNIEVNQKAELKADPFCAWYVNETCYYKPLNSKGISALREAYPEIDFDDYVQVGEWICVWKGGDDYDFYILKEILKETKDLLGTFNIKEI